MTILRDSYRAIIKLKERDDTSPVHMSFLFDAVKESYKELPTPDKLHIIRPEINKILEKNNGKDEGNTAISY